MHPITEIISDTVIGFLILALCLVNLFNLIGTLIYESTYGFGTLNEKSSSEAAYTVSKEAYCGFSQAQYYMLPIVDTENTRTMYKLNSNETYDYSGFTGEHLSNVFNKIMPVINNTENQGNLDKQLYYLEMDEYGTLRFIKEAD